MTVDHRGLDGWLRDATDPSVARPVAGQPIPYGLIRNEVAVSAQVTWSKPTVGQTLVDGWSVILCSLTFAGVAAFVFARRPEVPAATALMIAAGAAAGSSVPWFLGVTVSDVVEGSPFILYAIVIGPLYMLLWPAGLHFALVFPRPLGVVIRRRRLVPTVYALVMGGYLLAMLLAWEASPTWSQWVGSWPTAQVAVVVPTLALTLGLIVWRYLHTSDVTERAKIRWATLGAATSAALLLLVFMVPEMLFQQVLLPESWIGLAALPLSIGLAIGIMRDRLFDIDVVVNRTFVYGGLTLGVLAVYAGITSAIGTVVGGEHGFGVSLLATGIAALVALPLRDALQRSVNRLMYGQRDEPWQAMRRLGQRLQWAADPDRAFPAIVETVADALRLPYVSLELVDESGHAIPVSMPWTPAAVGRDAAVGARRRARRPARARVRAPASGSSAQTSLASWRISRARQEPPSTPCACATIWRAPASDSCSPGKRSGGDCDATCTMAWVHPWPPSACAPRLRRQGSTPTPRRLEATSMRSVPRCRSP